MNSITQSRIIVQMEDINKGMQQGRRMRSEAIATFLKLLVAKSENERIQPAIRRGRLSPDCGMPI